MLADAGLADAKVQSLETDEGVRIRVQNESLGLDAGAGDRRRPGRARRHRRRRGQPSPPSGRRGARRSAEKAFRALVFFLIAIAIYLTLRFEFKMAVATLAALVHDILVTVGVYAISGSRSRRRR